MFIEIEFMLKTEPAELMEDRQEISFRESIAFILRLGRALQMVGYPAYRLEAMLSNAARKLDLQAEFFAAPTSIYCGIGELEKQQTFLLRTEPGDLDLGKMVDLDQITQQVVNRKISPVAGTALIDAVFQQKPLYNSWLTTVAFCLASAASARLLGGGVREIMASGVIGILIGLYSLLASKIQDLSFVTAPVAAFIASAAASILSFALGPYGIFNSVLAGLIVLMPGLTLTLALAELSTRNLVAGISRLSAALIVFIGLGFGVALGNKMVGAIFGVVKISAPVMLPGWTEILALLIIPFAFTVLLRAHRRDSLWILIAGILAVSASHLGTITLGSELGPFLGALTVGLASRVYAQLLRRPSPVTLLPGILLLVPGSIGFRSIVAILDKQVVPGLETAFKMILMAMALVTGVLISSIVVPVRER